ncbi:hypothetical protein HMPREF0308_0447 [Corynebacterium striatum ATCC 6940]|nr:hypothetical protein HMPREF0308_0447 [Corynebacterium striatum ATCC 6940]
MYSRIQEEGMVYTTPSSCVVPSLLPRIKTPSPQADKLFALDT